MRLTQVTVSASSCATRIVASILKHAIDPEQIKLEPDPLTPTLSQRERVRTAARKMNLFRAESITRRHSNHFVFCLWEVFLTKALLKKPG